MGIRFAVPEDGSKWLPELIDVDICSLLALFGLCDIEGQRLLEMVDHFLVQV